MIEHTYVQCSIFYINPTTLFTNRLLYQTSIDTDTSHKPTYSIEIVYIYLMVISNKNRVSDLIKIIKAAGPAEPRNLILRYIYGVLL